VGGLSLACLVLYTVTSLVVSVRLILRSRHTRGATERLMGLTYLLAPGLGYPLAVLSPAIPGRELSLAALVVGETLVVAGCSCFLFFNAKVFRPSAIWATAAACVGIAALVVGGIGVVLANVSTPDLALAGDRARGAMALLFFTLGLGYAWTGIEGTRYHRMLRRRLVLGLAEPIVANRFLLWALAGLVSTVWNTVGCYYLLVGANVMTHPVPLLATSLGGLVSAVLQILIFMPPSWYARWVGRERSARTLATA
jgi:hypothetical protein